MMTLNAYKTLLNVGENTSLGDIRKRNSNDIFNRTMDGNTKYMKVRVLTQAGWQLVDAIFTPHAHVTMTQTSVDSHLQFRPGVHFPVGSYVIIQGENDDSLDTYEDVVDWFKHREENFRLGKRSQLWILADRTGDTDFVQYNILQTNWEFRWIYNGEVQSCIGVIRSSNSYTNGSWAGEYVTTLDNLSGAYLPDVYAAYGEKYREFGLCDNRSIRYGSRFMLTNNRLFPNVGKVTKIIDLAPPGIIALSLKQDEFDPRLDNTELLICNYYSTNGTSAPNEPQHLEPEGVVLTQVEQNRNTRSYTMNVKITHIPIGGSAVFKAKEWNGEGKPYWKVSLNEESADKKHPKTYYEKLVRIAEQDDGSVIVKLGKAPSLVGKSFTLCTYDESGNTYSEMRLEVDDYAT